MRGQLARWARIVAIVGVLVGLIAPLWAADPGEVRPELTESFRIIGLRDGLLLEPLDDASELPIVEVSGGELWLDGTPADDSTLAALGELEPAVRALAEFDEAELAQLSGSAGAGTMDGQALEVGPIEAAGQSPEEAPEAPEPPEEPGSTVYTDDQVVVGGNLVIEKHEVARDVVVVGGRLTILGRVNGDAAVIGGSADIEGEVNGDVAIVGGAAVIGEAAHIRGDVETVGGSVSTAEGAVIEGRVNEVSFGPGLRIGRWIEKYAQDAGAIDTEDEDDGGGITIDLGDDDDRRREVDRFNPVRLGWRLTAPLLWLAFVVLLSLLVFLLLRQPVERMAERARIEPAKCGLVGLVAQILSIPLLVVTLLVLVISVIGIPLLVLVPFVIVGVLLVSFFGFVAGSYQVGRLVRDRFDLTIESAATVLIIGLVAVQGLSIAGELFAALGRFLSFFAIMCAVFGALIQYVVWTIGLGSALLTRGGLQTDLSADVYVD